MGKNMKTILTVVTALITGLFLNSSAIAEDAKPAEWLFVHTAQTAEMTSVTTLIMPVTRDIFAFTDSLAQLENYPFLLSRSMASITFKIVASVNFFFIYFLVAMSTINTLFLYLNQQHQEKIAGTLSQCSLNRY